MEILAYTCIHFYINIYVLLAYFRGKRSRSGLFFAPHTCFFNLIRKCICNSIPSYFRTRLRGQCHGTATGWNFDSRWLTEWELVWLMRPAAVKPQAISLHTWFAATVWFWAAVTLKPYANWFCNYCATFNSQMISFSVSHTLTHTEHPHACMHAHERVRKSVCHCKSANACAIFILRARSVCGRNKCGPREQARARESNCTLLLRCCFDCR